jgi:hypothetical protein
MKTSLSSARMSPARFCTSVRGSRVSSPRWRHSCEAWCTNCGFVPLGARASTTQSLLQVSLCGIFVCAVSLGGMRLTFLGGKAARRIAPSAADERSRMGGDGKKEHAGHYVM